MLITQCPLVRHVSLCLLAAFTQLIHIYRELEGNMLYYSGFLSLCLNMGLGMCFVLLLILGIFELTVFSSQDLEKPSPPQKPLPADPVGRRTRFGHNFTAMGVHMPGAGPLPIPIPTVPRPPPSIPLPCRSVCQAVCDTLSAWNKRHQLSAELTAFCHSDMAVTVLLRHLKRGKSHNASVRW